MSHRRIQESIEMVPLYRSYYLLKMKAFTKRHSTLVAAAVTVLSLGVVLSVLMLLGIQSSLPTGLAVTEVEQLDPCVTVWEVGDELFAFTADCLEQSINTSEGGLN